MKPLLRIIVPEAVRAGLACVDKDVDSQVVPAAGEVQNAALPAMQQWCKKTFAPLKSSGASNRAVKKQQPEDKFMTE